MKAQQFVGSLLLILVAHSTNASLMTSLPYDNAGCCGGAERGYWFTSPVDFQMESIFLNTSSGLSSDFNFDVLRFTAIPVFNPASNSFTTLLAEDGVSGDYSFATPISFASGDIIGLLAYDVGSSRTPYASPASTLTIDGGSVSATRLYRQSLGLNDPVGSEPGFSTGAIGFSYSIGTPEAVPAPATLALFGLGLAGLGWSRRKKA
ncbi:MAG: PEP-CTERM sorting domain-containing protein [Halieaceae bacterium]|jgi:hypothetical protein|nr:PEP-CTERM sorting domain-containing protein [Halieaceae bacterium]